MAATRFKIPELPDFFFEIKNAQNSDSEKISIENISTTGIGLNKESQLFPEIGEEISGILVKGDNRIATKAKIIHKTNQIVGCEFTEALSQIEHLVSDELIRDLFPSLKNA